MAHRSGIGSLKKPVQRFRPKVVEIAEQLGYRYDENLSSLTYVDMLVLRQTIRLSVDDMKSVHQTHGAPWASEMLAHLQERGAHAPAECTERALFTDAGMVQATPLLHKLGGGPKVVLRCIACKRTIEVQVPGMWLLDSSTPLDVSLVPFDA